MKKNLYSKLLFYPLFLLLLNANSYGQVTLVNSGLPTICSGSSVTLSTNNPFDSYLWSNGETTATINVSMAGIYFVTVTDINANTFSSDTITTTLVSITASSNNTDVLCNGDQDGEIDITVIDGTSPYTFLWSNTLTTEDLTGLSGGNYTVTITDNNGCSGIVSFTVNEPLPINITTIVTAVTCFGGNDGSIDISVSGGNAGYIYDWDNSETTEDISSLVAGTYSLTVTDLVGCVGFSNAIVSDGLAVSPMITGINMICPGNTTSLDAGSGYSAYLWSGGETTQNITVGQGTYTVIVTNGAGCSGTSASFILNEYTAPAVAITAGGATSFCDGGSVVLTATSGFAGYLWSSGESTESITALIQDTYTVTVTDVNGCTATHDILVTVYPQPVVDIITLSDVLCKDDNNGVIEIAGNSGTAPYLFSVNGGGFFPTTTFTGLTPGVYDITVQDNNGCTSMTQFFINEPTDYLSASYVTTDVLCYGEGTGSIDLTVSGGTSPYQYEWSNASTTEDITDLVAGIYTVTVTDANGCELVFAIDIFEPSQIIIGTDFTNISCYGGSDGTAIVFVTGGTPGYSYLWNTIPVQTDFVAFNLSAGLHTVTITDLNGCIETQQFLIAEPPQLSSTSIVVDATCYGYSNGSATVIGSGGTPYQAGNPYTYSWNTIPVQTTSTATGLEAGSYTATLIDSTGCIKYSIVTVNEPNQFLVATSNVNVLCNGDNNGESTAIVTGGTAPYNYSWNTVPVQTSFIATGLAAGLYTVTVTDFNGCIASINSLINQPLPLLLNSSVQNVTCNGGTDGKVLLNVTGGNAPYSYFWNTNPSQTNNNIINVIAGTYTVIVTDSKGCTASGTYTITEPIKINTNEIIVPVNCFGGNTGSVTLNVSGGVLPYLYFWSNGNTTNAISNLTFGSYTITITDGSSCVETKTFVVGQTAEIIITATLTAVSCSGGSNGSIISTVSGGDAPYSYLWSNGSTTSATSGLSAGVYALTITDNKGCVKSSTFIISQPSALTCICNANIVNVSCFGGSDGSITAMPSGGTAPYSYLWSNGQATQTANSLIAGVYTVTITDANGCQAVGVITVTEPTVLSVFATATSINCNAASNGIANAIVTGGTPPYTYLWNTVPAQTTQVATGLPPGTFTVTVTDSKNCTSFSSATITQPTSLSCSTTSTNITCNGSINGTASVVASGGSAPYSYLWNTIPAKTTTTVIGLSSGTYTVTITDSHGCTKTCQATISQPSALVALYVPTNLSCFGGSNGAIDLTVTGGTSPYTYSWSNGITTQDLTGVTAGVYTVYVNDQKGCNLTAMVTLTHPSALVCNSSSTNVSCQSGSNGTAAVSVTGGTAPYQYLWSNGVTNSTATGLPAGIYSVTVTDFKGCTTICNVNVTQPSLLSCSIITCCDTIVCFGELTGALDVVVIGGTPPYTYLWNTSPVQTSAIASGLGAGSYSVIVTDSKGCTTSCSYTLGQPGLLTCSATGTAVTCNGGSDGTATVVVTGGTAPYSYLWNTLVAQTTASITGLTSGTYTVFVTDANGCTTSCVVIVTTPGALNLTITQTNINCSGAMNGTATAVVSGGTSPYGYLWSNGETTATVTGLSAITYTVTVTDVNGCSASASISITQTAGISCSTTETPVSCYGGNNGTATVTASGGTAPLTYAWNTIPVQNTVTATGLTAGSYIVIITDANGCTTSCSATITEPGLLSCSTTVLQNVTCYGGQNGSASVTASGGTAPYSYSWNTVPVQTNASATGLEAGTYGVTITDFNGCTTSCNVSITQPDELLCSTSGVPTNCGNDDGQATVTATGGVLPYSYLWSDGQTTATATGLASGDYTITITDLNGCTTSCFVNIGSSSSLIAIIGGTDVSCNGNSDGTAFVAVAGGEPPYTYLWNTIPSQTTDTITGLIAGTYTIVATDINGCTISKTITINEPTAIVINIIKTDVLCFGGNSGIATANATGGTAPYGYLWSNGQTTQTSTGLTSGNYTVTVTDFFGCSSTKSTTISEPSLLNCSTSHIDPTCYNGTDGEATVFASGGTIPYSYLWSNGQTTQTATGLISGTYTITVTDANGCISICITTLASVPPPSCLIIGNESICSGGSVQWCAPVGLSGYLWSNGATTQCVLLNTAGTYTVTVTDANGCTSSCYKTLQVNPLPSCLILGNGSICAGNSTQWCAPSGLTEYLWSTGSTNQCVTLNIAGIYTVTVTDANGCTSSCDKTLLINPLPSCLITGNDSICSGGSTLWCAPAGLSYYLWSTGETTQCISVNLANTYMVTVTDANGCISECVKTLVVNSALSCNIIGTKPSCFGGNNGTATISVSGGTSPYTLLWSNGQTTLTATGLVAGIYSATVTDNFGCTTSCSVTIAQPDLLEVTVLKDKDVSCFGGNDASAEANPIGGTAPYSYLWSNSATTKIISGVIAGTYTVTVTDASGCTATGSVTLIQPGQIVATTISSNVSCFGGNNGTAIVNAISGGIAPYGYSWSTVPVQTTAGATGLTAGNYTVTVTDANGCTITKTVVISQPTILLCSANSTNSICSANNGTVTVIATGGTPGYFYLWNTIPAKTTSTVTGLGAGTYTVIVTDNNNCTTSCSVVVSGSTSNVTCSILKTDVSCFGGNNGSATVSASGGTGPYAYLWNTSPVQTNATATGLIAGGYQVTVTDVNGCTSVCTTTIYQPTALVLVFTKVTHVGCNGGNTGTAEATISGGTPGYTYLWSNGQTVAYITGLVAGTYSVTVTDSKGCTKTGSVVINQSSSLGLTIAKTNVSCNGGANGTATATVTGGTSPYSYSWNTVPVKTTASVTGLVSGTYIVTVSDFNGCTKTASVNITQPSAISISFSKVSQVACFGGNSGAVEVNPSGGSPGYTFLWSNGMTVQYISGLVAGTYTVTVTDSHACTKTGSITITQPSAISCSTAVTNVTCYGSANGTATVTATGGVGPYTYFWNTSPVKTTQTISGLAAGTYTVSVVDANNCNKTCTAIITQPTAVTISFTKVVHVACFGGNNGTAEVVPGGGTPGYTILWSTGQTIPYITNLIAGTYIATVTDSKGCTKSASVIITQPQVLTCNTTTTSANCNGGNGSATVTANGGTAPYYYSWNTSPVKTTQTITGLNPGSYIVTVTDNKGCTSSCTAIVSSSGFSLSLLSPVYVGGKNIRCKGEKNGSINLTVSGATCSVSYLWSNGKTTEDINTLYAGTYTVTVSSCGCTATASITLLQPAALTLTKTSTNVSCNGASNGTATVTATGGTAPYLYSWNTIPVKTTNTVTGLATGTYTVTVGDANGCTKSTYVCITQPASLNVTGNICNVGCNSVNNGSINITASGGTSPYSYLWNNGSTNEDRSGLVAGTYTVTVTDNKGCTKSATFAITQGGSVSCSIITNMNVSCFGGCNGSLTASATGGSGPYTYSWNTTPCKTTATISGLCSGTYTVTITDSQGCSCSSSKTITQPTAITVNTSQTNVTNYGGNNGTATASPTGGTSPYTYAWNTSPVKTTQTITGLLAGTYVVVVTDFKGCTKSATVCITQPAACQLFKSYTVGGWGAAPNGNNPGTYLANNFAAAFPNGISIGDCGRKIILTSANAVKLFLPSGGTPRRLNSGTLTNPTSSSYGNTLAGQLVALKLNMTFDAYDANFAPSSATLFKSLIISTGTFMGWTVEQLFNEANYKIGCGGCSSSYYSSLNNAITCVNQSWDNGVNTNGFLVCPGTPLRPLSFNPEEEMVKDINLVIYPNPTNGQVNLRFHTEKEVDYRLVVTDLTGRIIYAENSQTESGENGRHYDYTLFQKGVYIIQTTIGGSLHTNRIVIQ